MLEIIPSELKVREINGKKRTTNYSYIQILFFHLNLLKESLEFLLHMMHHQYLHNLIKMRKLDMYLFNQLMIANAVCSNDKEDWHFVLLLFISDLFYIAASFFFSTEYIFFAKSLYHFILILLNFVLSAKLQLMWFYASETKKRLINCRYVDWATLLQLRITVLTRWPFVGFHLSCVSWTCWHFLLK